jgi:hypothetical protein
MPDRNSDFVYLHNPHEFDARFLEKTMECDTYEEAYYAVEEEYKSTFGTTKYSSYNSYRVSRRHRIKHQA